MVDIKEQNNYSMKTDTTLIYKTFSFSLLKITAEKINILLKL